MAESSRLPAAAGLPDDNSLRCNVALGETEKLRNCACKSLIRLAWELVEQLPHGVNTILGNGGSSLRRATATSRLARALSWAQRVGDGRSDQRPRQRDREIVAEMQRPRARRP